MKTHLDGLSINEKNQDLKMELWPHINQIIGAYPLNHRPYIWYLQEIATCCMAIDSIPFGRHGTVGSDGCHCPLALGGG